MEVNNYKEVKSSQGMKSKSRFLDWFSEEIDAVMREATGFAAILVRGLQTCLRIIDIHQAEAAAPLVFCGEPSIYHRPVLHCAHLLELLSSSIQRAQIATGGTSHLFVHERGTRLRMAGLAAAPPREP
jgi:hypothetical protein